MSLFGNQFFTSPSAATSSNNNSNTSFHPLFRLLDDFEQHSRNNTSADGHPLPTQQGQRQHRPAMKTFTPKFDVKEVAEAYELHGDLPGIEQKDVEIEFTDVQTITVRGRTERSFTSGTPPSASIEGTPARAAIEGSGSGSGPEQANKPAAAHKATVEDEDADASSKTIATTGSSTKQVEKAEPKAKYWVSERSVGEFSRSFTFPVRVDQDGVRASMKNGVLSITVPKAKKHEAKKIQIWSA